MSGYIGTQPVPQATQTRDTFTATAGQTSFATSGYTPNFLDVFLNGVHLVNGADYTATNGSDVVLTSGAALNDTLQVISYSTYQVNAQTYTGGLTIDNSGATVLTVDRASSDGTIIDLQKDGSTVGSIGTLFGDLYVATGNTGIRCVDANRSISAYDSSAGALVDAAIDLGYASVRYKNLYLSGGVYLGGTGSANLLDDYEEGIWTPTLNSTDATYTYPRGQKGYYTKVGDVVVAQFYIGADAAGTTTNNVVIGGLPFTSKNLDPLAQFSATAWVSTSVPIGFTVGNNSTVITMWHQNNGIDFVKASEATNGYLVGHAVYKAD